jgi:hypothetical protein
MWTLVLFTLFTNSGSGGGVNSTVTILDFASEASCFTAAKLLEADGSFNNDPPTAYRIFGKCIQRGSVRGRF